jgi:lipopolysaccharide transport system ATP-binding protein
MPTAIEIENLGKKYSITAERSGGSQYIALRDVLAESAKNVAQRILHPTSGRAHPRKEDFWAIKDLNLKVEQGDKVAIIGHNGAGKSTLLKLLSQITEPTTGSIKLYGRVSSLLEVGTGFHPELTGRENIYLNGSILGMSHAEVRRKFDEIVAFSGVEKFLETPVKRYSSGMRMRLGFAVAAHLESEILIIDEVLAVGDAEFQKKCLGKMDDISREGGRTILFVSHNMSAVQQLCNKGIVLNRGQLVFEGKTLDAISCYNHLISQRESEIFIMRKNQHLNIANYKTAGSLLSGDDVSFYIDFESDLNFGSCIFHFDIYNRNTPRIYHYAANTNFLKIKKGINRICVSLPNICLNGGDYFSAIFLTQDDGTIIFDAKEFPTCQITNNYSYVTYESILSQPCSVHIEYPTPEN